MNGVGTLIRCVCVFGGNGTDVELRELMIESSTMESVLK